MAVDMRREEVEALRVTASRVAAGEINPTDFEAIISQMLARLDAAEAGVALWKIGAAYLAMRHWERVVERDEWGANPEIEKRLALKIATNAKFKWEGICETIEMRCR